MRLDSALPDTGTFGVWARQFVTAPADEVRDAARAIEEMGFRTVWYPESRGRDAITTAALILSAADTLVVATGIANVWARDGVAAAAAAQSLGEAFPGRFVLGLGVSHAPSVSARGAVYERPMRVMEEYLDAMEATRYGGPPAEVPVVLAALGPRMLRLGADRTSGVHPYFVPVSHSTFAREQIGEGPWLAPEQAVVLATDPDEARAIARRHTSAYLALDNYRRSILRLGWDEAELEDGGSDSLVDAVVAWGDVDAAAARLRRHREEGADHVSIQLLAEDGEAFPLAGLRSLAAELL